MEEYWQTRIRTPNMTQFIPWTLYPKKGGFGAGGQNNWSEIGGNRLKFIKDLNNNGPVLQNMIWERGGSIYVYVPKKGEPYYKKAWQAPAVRWPRIGVVFNVVKVVEREGDWNRIEGIPADAELSTDLINRQKTPWLVHRIWCGGKKDRSGKIALRNMPKGAADMGLFEPVGLPGTGGDGLWLHISSLEKRLDDPLAPLVPPDGVVVYDNSLTGNYDAVTFLRGSIIWQRPQEGSQKIRKLIKSETLLVYEIVGDWYKVFEGWIKR
jgi:hypothetical protein